MVKGKGRDRGAELELRISSQNSNDFTVSSTEILEGLFVRNRVELHFEDVREHDSV